MANAFTRRLMLLGKAWREVWAQGYSLADFTADLRAGVVVGFVALTLGMAMAVAVGLLPQNGLYAIVIAGVVAALAGGSRFQVTGPSAAFVVILIPIVQQYGIAGVSLAGIMAGCLLVIFGILGMGRIIEVIPHPVVTGFTSGIGLVMLTLEVKDLLGLTTSGTSHHYLQRLWDLAGSIGTWRPTEAGVAALTIAVILMMNRFVKKTPAPLVGLVLATVAVALVQHSFPDIRIDTIATRFTSEEGGRIIQGIPQGFPEFRWPWSRTLSPGFDLQLLADLFPAAFTIALIGAIESLLSATVADGMTRTRHDPNAELMAQGLGNIVAPFFGGMPTTGAIARTATNIRFGARSPVSSIVHAGVILLCLLVAAPLASMIPMAALAAVLTLVAINIADPRHFRHILKAGTLEDKAVLCLCFALTVVIDMTAGVIGGVVLSTLLFMNRIAKLTVGMLSCDLPDATGNVVSLPKEVQVYRISGPMFFGAAQRAMASLSQISIDVKLVILDLSAVNVMDITGWTALESSLMRLNSAGIDFCFSGVNATLARQLRGFAEEKFRDRPFRLYPSLAAAIAAVSGTEPQVDPAVPQKVAL